ncbi:hypothetical protein SAMN04487965_1971 [Microbulbifer donghaiensis]|uniref:Uncharacterized protein n=1 Tax=Microbulbifer donghaiensis TaxID=494016 RepID=A0A1M5ATX1_9GAMM|nr:YheV family putative zinc ribbon protein [Microbulbifer donghaiensis]SHF33689.1 hypothetical protein SAMN04487965_1971 [Microbulbifer donghaiensis]
MIMTNDSDKRDKPPKKRFIAGAVCPRCSAMDRIVNYREGEKNYRECIACGFKDEIRLQSSPLEPATRVNESGKKEAVETPIKIIQPTKK